MPKGKIIKALSGFYYVQDEKEQIYQCRGRGIFRNRKVSPLVGDSVVFQIDQRNEGTITEIEPRANELIRPAVANVDQVILVFSSIEPDFSPLLLDRFLVLIEHKGIEPIICISKIDLLGATLLEKINMFSADYQLVGYKVLLLSSETNRGVEEFRPFLNDKISVFAGQSGVGKSSLLNALNTELSLETASISTHLGRGKHTTRHVELMEIGNGLVADTPGFSTLDFSDIETDELGNCFPEISEASRKCKFRGCLHAKESSCAVKEKVESGNIRSYRYQHYLQFLEEIIERKPRYR